MASNAPIDDFYVLPSLGLLSPMTEPRILDKADLTAKARLLEKALRDFGVEAQVVDLRPGPVVTLFELELAPGVRSNRVMALADDIARTMSATSARITGIAGRNVIGVELPNPEREPVSLSELIGSQAFQDHPDADLPLILGKDIAGTPIIVDLASMPHLLVAGTTGSGKSVGLNCMILSLLYRLTPDQCRMVMIDPKMLEFGVYEDIPHLLAPVITDSTKAVHALDWMVRQMEGRYRIMSAVGARSLASFNGKVRSAQAVGKPLRVNGEMELHALPLIVIVIDEVADLMATAGRAVETSIQRLAQKARAAGIHLVLATQHPSSEVITSTIKASLPARISFRVMNHHASRTILGEAGAEQLLGKGDMLVLLSGEEPARVHGAFATDEDCQAVADHWRHQSAPEYIAAIIGDAETEVGAWDDVDEQYNMACQLVTEAGNASASWLQRQLRIDYNSAAQLIERMEHEGLISSPDHVGRRSTLAPGAKPNASLPPKRGWLRRMFGP